MKKFMLIQLFLLLLVGLAQAQNFTGVYNPPTQQFGTTPDLNREYRLVQNGNTVTGEIIHKKENMKATLTGTVTNGVVTGTLKYNKHQFASLDQKFRIFFRPNETSPIFMHESTSGARNYGGAIFKNDALTKQQTNQTQAATSLQQGSFSSGSGTVVQQATVSPNVGVAMPTTPKKNARNIGGYYRIEGMTDANGTKRNLFVNVRNFPDAKDRSKAYGEALILGEAYGIGSPQGKLFGYETNSDDVTVMFDPIFEQNKKVTMANGRIVNTSGGMSLVAPKSAYRMVKISQAEAERESKKLSPTVKVRVEYKFIYLGSSTYWDRSFLNYVLTDEGSIALYGTGSIRAFRETSSNTTELKAIGNASARIFDIPKSRASSKSDLSYFDKTKNRSWGGIYDDFFGFYSFAKDADMPKSEEGVTRQAIFPVNRFLEFEVSRAALEGKTERIAIDGHAHLSNALPLGDANFGNMNRRVYLHELTDQRKLTEDEKKFNRKLEGKLPSAGALVSPPYYFFAVKKDQRFKTPAVMIAFTVEIIE